ncbi:RecB family exonuclease [Cohnella thermotolerans]|uniref:RecB family exonuclease n=1 Tax=Cohnella thermotolerans TaxID=329858 RepID=UPI00146F9AA9|nr:PD-(D/E)XK nuclease family protein [Cohnella thermotolerans]
MNNVRKFPELSWSLSRHKRFLECKRNYWYSYYGAFGGWQNESSNLTRHIYRLKTLQSIHMVFGSSVHNQIQRFTNNVRSTRLPSETEIISNIRSDLNKAYQDSRYRQRLWVENPGDYKMLMEIYYDNDLPLDVIEEYQTKLPLVAKNLISSETVNDLFRRGDEIEVIAAERFRCIERNGIKIWVVMDLVFRDKLTGKYVIVDFKTGKSSANDVIQLVLYAWFIQQIFGIVSLDQIELRSEYLADGRTVTYTPSSFDLEKTEYLLNTSIEWMRSYLLDIDQNIPAEMDEFEQTTNQRTCQLCSFRELCGRV